MTDGIDLGIEGLIDYEEIGRGGFATVYSARQIAFNRQVAVKVLDALDEAGLRRFNREQLSMGTVDQHPNIVTPFSAGYTQPDGKPYLIMEYISRGSLQRRLDETGPIELDEAIKLILPVAEALGHSHSSGIIHKDVKPANILVSSSGIVKLTDFGIATLQEATATAAVAFSVAYSPPETFGTADPTGSGDPRDERSDLYSLAATLYMLITGGDPFGDPTNNSPAGYMARILTQPVPSLGHPELDTFLATAMAKNPADRYPSAGQFIDALRLIAQYQPPVTQTPSSAPIGGAPLPPSSRGAAPVSPHSPYTPPSTGGTEGPPSTQQPIDTDRYRPDPNYIGAPTPASTPVRGPELAWQPPEHKGSEPTIGEQFTRQADGPPPVAPASSTGGDRVDRPPVGRYLAALAAVTVVVVAAVVVAAMLAQDPAPVADNVTTDNSTAAASDEGGVDDEEEESGDEGAVETALPGQGVTITIARANWSSGYFQAAVYRQLLQELGYEVSDPADLELSPSDAYLSMARGDLDFWANSWYPGHQVWHQTELPDGSKVGDHVESIGEEMTAGGLQGYLVTKSFADEFGITHLDQINDDPGILAAFDESDAIPGDGMAQIYGCHESWTCDEIILNQIAFSGWDNIEQIMTGYDATWAEAVAKVNNDEPMVVYTWTPSAYITELRPGDNVVWLAVEEVLDDSNPANQDGGDAHSQLPGTASVGPEQCPAAAEEGTCRIGWLASDIQVTANSKWLTANPVGAELLAQVALPLFDVSLAAAEQASGRDTNELASEWIAKNRDQVDPWLEAARAAG